MKILFLYGNENALSLARWLSAQGQEVTAESGCITPEHAAQFELLVSYTYRHILPASVLDAVEGNAVNLHISYLPWNRGANPNQWSILENTPQGVTLHYMAEQLDAGDIIAQRLLHFESRETLASSYQKLGATAEELFRDAFCFYRFWPQMRKKPQGVGSYHNVRDFAPYAALIAGNYEMTLAEFSARATAVHP